MDKSKLAKEKIALRAKIREKFKVTLNENMDVKTLTSQWQKVPKPIRDEFPEIDSAMTALLIIYEAQVVSVEAAIKARKIYTTTKEAVELASAVKVGQFQFPIAKAAAKASDVLVEKKTELLDVAKVKLLEKFSNVLEVQETVIKLQNEAK
jgi:hypothetical protein